MNCVDVCPKGLNPTKAIGKIKELMVRRVGLMSLLDERSFSKLRWRCRRGLLENDLFIERFFANAHEGDRSPSNRVRRMGSA